MSTTATTTRPLHEIAKDIRENWPKPYFGAVPYIDAMASLSDMNSMYGWDNARSVVLYFLANTQTWRGEKAKAIKAELKEMLK